MHIYILGSPRTGSTVLYQLISRAFPNHLYISNQCNEEYSTNILEYFDKYGDEIRNYKKRISYKNSYGKTEHFYEPSEGSAVFNNWFGGDHPSETASKNFVSGKRADFTETHNAISNIHNAFLVTKNVWNCFRIQSLVTTDVPIFFIWIRRGLFDSAISDLDARYAETNSGGTWTPATTKHHHEIERLPSYMQAVEHQYHLNSSIGDSLAEFAQNNHIEVWFEDLCKDPKNTMFQIAKKAGAQGELISSVVPQELTPGKRRLHVTNEDEEKLQNHIQQNRSKYSALFKLL